MCVCIHCTPVHTLLNQMPPTMKNSKILHKISFIFSFSLSLGSSMSHVHMIYQPLHQSDLCIFFCILTEVYRKQKQYHCTSPFVVIIIGLFWCCIKCCVPIQTVLHNMEARVDRCTLLLWQCWESDTEPVD